MSQCSNGASPRNVRSFWKAFAQTSCTMSSTSLSRRAYRRAVAKTRGEYFLTRGSKLAESPFRTAAMQSASVGSMCCTQYDNLSLPAKAESHRPKAVAFGLELSVANPLQFEPRLLCGGRLLGCRGLVTIGPFRWRGAASTKLLQALFHLLHPLELLGFLLGNGPIGFLLL